MSAIVVMMIISAMSAAYGAYSSIQMGRSQNKFAQYNAAIAKNNAIGEQHNADLARKKALANAERQKRKGEAQISSQRAKIGKSGVQVTGSPLLVLEEQAGENELDIQSILYSGELEARGHEGAAANYGLQAKEAIFKGQQSKTASYYQAGTSLLSGAEKVAGAYNYGTRTEKKT